MLCPECGADVPEGAKKCPACRSRLARSRRQEDDESNESPFARQSITRNRTAIRAYRYSVISLIPILGLLMGPLALVLAYLAWREGRREPTGTQNSFVVAALLLGTASLFANGIGVTLMVLGLMSGN
jgi:hypothetical protein